MQRSFLRFVFRLILAPAPMLASFSMVHAAEKQSDDAPLIKVAEYHLKHARQGAAAAALDDYLYVFGGYAGGALGYVERLDVNTGVVEVVTSKASARRYHTALEYGGRFYLFGGEGHSLNRGYESIVEIFDPRDNSLNLGPEMPAPLSAMAAVKVANKAYFFGGKMSTAAGRGWSTAALVYDFPTGKWGRLAEVPFGLEGNAVEIDSFPVIFGGFNGRVALSSVLAFSPAENGWKELPPLPRKLSAHSVAKLGDHVFLFGDYEKRNQVLAYDLTNMEARQIKTDFKGVRHSVAVVHRNRIYVIGGNLSTSNRDESDLIQVFELNTAYAPNQQ